MIEEKSQKFFRISNLILIGGIAVLVVGILAMFNELDKRVKSLEETINQLNLSDEKNDSSQMIGFLPAEIKKEMKKEGLLPESDWNKIKSFQGIEGSKTNVFSVPTDQWRIKWELSLDPQKNSVFSFDVYRTADQEKIESVSFRSIPGMERYSEGTYIYEGKTDYYLDIKTESLKEWEVVIESI